METRKKTYYYCCVPGCSNSTLSSELSFFKLPADSERRTRWLQLIDQADLLDSSWTRTRVCEAHFPPDSVLISAQRKHLKKTSLPQLLLPTLKSLDKGTQKNVTTVDKCVQCYYYIRIDSQTQTPLHLLKDTQRKRQLLSEIETCRKRQKVDIISNRQSEMSMFHELCDKLLAKNLARIIKQQSQMKALRTRNRFSFDYKFFCMNLYYISPQAYRLLENTLCLPSKPTLMKMHIPVSSKTNNHLLDVLKTKVQYMSDVDRHCTLVVDAVSLKMNLFYNIREDKIYGFHEVDGVQSPELAKFAIVAMIQGLFKNYKQLVGFALLAECKYYQSVSDWINKLILKLFSIGLNVRILVTDMASDYFFFNSATNRSVSAERPYFFVGRRKIYYIFDTQHLVKLVRNNLMTYEFHFEKNVAKWQHIIEFYTLDKLKRLRLAPKLTENHIKPTNLERIKVKYAVQVFSASVAAGLSTYKDFGLIEYSSEGTIKVIELINDLFDFLNTSSRYGKTQYQNAFCGEEYQIYFINDVLNFLASLKVINPSNGQNITTKVKFIEGFQITLRSLLLLAEELRSEKLPYILTKRLSKECIENFFGQIKTKKGNSTKSTSWQLVSSYKKVFFENILKSPNSGSCADALAKCLLDWETLYASSARQKRDPETFLKTASNRNENEGNSETNLMPPISTTDYNKLDLPKNNALVYISGYLLKKCLDQHKECNDLIADTKDGNLLKTFKDTSYTHYENYIKDGAKDVLAKPPDSFVEFVRLMEERFCIFFELYFGNCSVLNSLLNEVKLLTFPKPCKCFPVAYCKRLYMRMRIYLSLKYNNRVIKQQDGDRMKLFTVTNVQN